MSFQPNTQSGSPFIPYDPYWPQPSDVGLLAWSTHPFACGTSYTAQAGIGLYTRVTLPQRITVSNVLCAYTTAATANTNAFFGIFDSSGVRRGVSSDQSTPLQTVSPQGGRVVAISADSNQSLIVGPGFIWVGLVIGAFTQAPVFRSSSSSNSATTFGQSAAPFMVGTIGTGLTALPTSITPGSMTGSQGPILLGLT